MMQALAESQLRLLDVGPLRDWTVTGRSFDLASQPPDVPRRIKLTRALDPEHNVKARRWLEMQEPFAGIQLSQPRGETLHPYARELRPLPQEPRIFWRLCVRDYALGLGILHFATAEAAGKYAGRVIERADAMRLWFIFAGAGPARGWLAADASGAPVMIGMPGSRLGVTLRPETSIAGAFAAATVQVRAGTAHGRGRAPLPVPIPPLVPPAAESASPGLPPETGEGS